MSLIASGWHPEDAATDIDEAEALRALELLVDKAEGFQLGVSHGGSRYRAERFAGGDLAAALDWLKGASKDAQAAYVTLNPFDPGLDHPLRVADVIRWRWLTLDIDPVRPDGSNATAEEKEVAADASYRVMDELMVRGWPEPVLNDTGSGVHLLYRVSEPNDADWRKRMKRIVASVAAMYGQLRSDAKGWTPRRDLAVFDSGPANPAGQTRLPGTWNRKGPHSDQRPHRKVTMRAPAFIDVVPTALLMELAGPDPAAPAVPPAGLRAWASDGPREQRYVQAALRGEMAKVEASRSVCEGGEGRNKQLNKSAYALGGFVPSGLLTEGQIEAALLPAAVRVGLDERASRTTIASGIRGGQEKPRLVPESQPLASVPAVVIGGGNANPVEDDGTAAVSYPASEVKPVKVRWLWPGRIPLGKLTTFAGHGGLGKTFVLCDVTARVTTGSPWPDGSLPCEPGGVLFISGEDDPDDTLVPRLIELNADLGLVRFLNEKAIDRFTLAHLPMLEKALAESAAPVRLVVIDPPTAFLAGVDDHKNAELRQLLRPLKDWARRYACSIVFNTHVNKGAASMQALERVMGSVAWVNAVRAAHMFAKDPDDPLKRVFIPMKNNLGPERKGLAYRIAPRPDDRAAIDWLGEVDTTADQAVAPAKQKSRKENAAAWLVEAFKQKLEWPSDDLYRAAHQDGISRSALWEAKGVLDLPRARKVIDVSGNTTWWWWVPADWPPLKVDGGTPL